MQLKESGGWIAMLGQRLAEIRKDNDDRQEDLAKKLSVSKFTVSSWEQGKSCPPVDVVIRICNLYDVSADYLLGLIDWDISYEATRRQEEFTPEEYALIRNFEDFIRFQRNSKNGSRGN